VGSSRAPRAPFRSPSRFDPFRLHRAQAWHIALLQRGGHQLHVAGVHEFHPQKGRQGQVEAIDGAPPGKMWGKCGAKNPGMWILIDLAHVFGGCLRRLVIG